MKTYLLGAAAAFAMAAPGVAHADTTGHVGLSYNSLDVDLDSNMNDYLLLNGAVATDLGNGWNLQFDAQSANMNHSSHNDSMTAATVHAFGRDGGWAWGGFAGFTGGEIDGIYVGAEAAWYVDRFTFAGNVLYGFDRQQSGTNFTSADLTGDYYFTDNFSVGAEVDWYSWNFDGTSADNDGTTYGVNAEYQFANSPFSVFGGYHWADTTVFDTDNNVSSFTLGFRYNFGTGSLIERDHSGASMRGGSQLGRQQVFSWD